MHEDSSLELGHLRGRILSVASAGDTALALSAVPGNDVTAVDLNAAQIRYVWDRLAGGGRRAGLADRAMAVGRALSGWRPGAARRFLDLDDPSVQAAAWHAAWDTPRFAAFLAVAFAPFGGRLGLPRRFDLAVRGRLADGFARHPNASNPQARLLLLGVDRRAAAGGARPLDLHVADVATFLERGPASSWDGFALSNVADAAGPAYARRLVAAVTRAAAPGATVVLRSFAEPRTDAEAEWARRDRTHIWGRVLVGPAEALADW
jgi:hypothetical protein